jgi:hypothetical protein
VRRARNTKISTEEVLYLGEVVRSQSGTARSQEKRVIGGDQGGGWVREVRGNVRKWEGRIQDGEGKSQQNLNHVLLFFLLYVCNEVFLSLQCA